MTITDIAVSTGAVIAAMTGIYMLLKKGWKMLRKIVRGLEVINGREERYEGDPEAKPGLVQMMDDLNRTTKDLHKATSNLAETTSKLVETTDELTRKTDVINAKLDATAEDLDSRIGRIEETLMKGRAHEPQH